MNRLTRLWRTVSVASAVVSMLLVPGASAQEPGKPWPARPLRIVVGFAAGGVADTTARVVAAKLADQLGQPVVVENRPSAGGIVAADTVAKAEADGTTLLLLSNGNAVSATLFRSLPYDTLTDFAPVSLLGTFDVAVVARSDAPIASIADLVAAARARPGRLNVGTINVGSTQHLSAELFKSMAAIDATIVPYKGSPAVITALRAGDVEVAFEMLAPVLPQAAGGAIRILAVGGERRAPALPDVPTVAEAGVAGYVASSWNAIAVPARTPPAIVERLAREIARAIAAPDVRERLAAAGVTPRSSTPGELRRLLAADIDKWRAVIERAGIERQ
ncbi:MAG: tripartite tricarboxylate transporter substrate binding protein [Burkholderiales bacterium]